MAISMVYTHTPPSGPPINTYLYYNAYWDLALHTDTIRYPDTKEYWASGREPGKETDSSKYRVT
jgi:hypothetical protein